MDYAGTQVTQACTICGKGAAVHASDARFYCRSCMEVEMEKVHAFNCHNDLLGACHIAIAALADVGLESFADPDWNEGGILYGAYMTLRLAVAKAERKEEIQ